MMQKLLQWSMAETQGDPTQVVTLPPILEEEEPEQLTNNHERPIYDILDKPQHSRPYTNPPTNHHRPQFHSCAFNSCAVRWPITDKKRIKKPQKPKTNQWGYQPRISTWLWAPDGTAEGKSSCLSY
jgi:hypothetical protein